MSTPTDARPSFRCPVCAAVSHHPDDVRNGYCGHCHAFTAVCMLCLLPGCAEHAAEIADAVAGTPAAYGARRPDPA